MDPKVFDAIAWQLDPVEVCKKVRVDVGAPEAGEIRRLLEVAQTIGRPKALYKEAFLDSRDDDGVVIDGVRFASRVLRVNLDKAERVFVYLATCGTELHDWAHSLDDMLEQYWADVIMEMALRKAVQYLNERIGEVIPHGKTSAMNPGSLRDWPITQQRPLFGLLDGAEDTIGITLTDSCLMVPAKSVSGLRFPTEVRFENCQLCPRKDCPGRRAVYDKDLYQRKYARQGA
jgi:hypothetical protein